MSPEFKKQEKILPVEPYYLTKRIHSKFLLKQQGLITKMDTYYPIEYQQAAHGDWRENSPKDTLDNEWSLDTAQLNKLNDQITRSVVIEDLNIETHQVVPGAKVILVNPDDKSEISLTMVSFTDLKEGYLSINSEAGKMLLGKMRADQVRLQKNGATHYVLDIQKPDDTLPIENLEPRKDIPTATLDQESQTKPLKTQQFVVEPRTTVIKTPEVQPPIQEIRPKLQQTEKHPEPNRKRDFKPLVNKDEERFRNLLTRVPKMGGQIKSQTTSTKDLGQGKKETRSTIEFIAGENRFKAELVIRPKVESTQYRHTKRRGTSAEVTHIYGDEEIKILYVYKLDINNWVLVDFK